ncbi:hypothetical protein [Photobacterium damselae]|uniref:hypothetical protein n=1 Tax=Photobacterium damselae TaxID=38293 RepID=UPI004069082A
MNTLSVIFYGSELDRFSRFANDKDLLLHILKDNSEAKLVSLTGEEFVGRVLRNDLNNDFSTFVDGSYFESNFVQYQIEIINESKMSVKGISHIVKH